jgi:hypothetical protein
MPLSIQLKRILKNDWFIALCLSLIFLATNGYTYGWDDQHLEIPLLKSLIDPNLYVGDYYVQALKANFTSFLFPILAKVITVAQVPSAYFLLYLLSRFFLFLYAYKLWKLIARNRFSAMLCVLSFILVFRVEEFLYRTFSHQEFALAIIMAAIYYFYKNRFSRAAILFGIAANFHALYSFFPFCYMGLYLLWKAREDQGKTLFKSIGLFILFSVPFIIWTCKRIFTHVPTDPTIFQNWIDLYKIACPQTFLFDNQPIKEMLTNFSSFLIGTQHFWPIAALWALNFAHNATFRNDKKAHAFIIAGGLFLLMAFIFSYVFPNRFILDLNLARNLQFMKFILIGYTTLLVIEKIHLRKWDITIFTIILFSLLQFETQIAALAALAIFFLLYEKKGITNLTLRLFFTVTIVGIIICFRNHHFSQLAIITIYSIMAATILFYLVRMIFNKNINQTILILIPFLALTINGMYYYHLRLEIEHTASSFWQLQRNWIDMQNYVRNNTPKEALILTPNDMEMGGFRVFSERKVLVCYRDCGIIGFDYKAALEWKKRLHDVEHFKVFTDGDIKSALINAISKYKVNYIVFMRYLNPNNTPILEPVYENDAFALYRVTVNPL